MYAAAVRTGVRGASAIGGTQTIDSDWGRMSRFVPKSLAPKSASGVNPAILVYAYAWLWRTRFAGDDMLSSIGRLASKAFA